MYRANNVKYTKFCELKEETVRLRKEITLDIMRNNMKRNNSSEADLDFFENISDCLYDVMIPFFQIGYIDDAKRIKEVYKGKEYADFLRKMGINLKYDKDNYIYIIEEPKILNMFS